MEWDYKRLDQLHNPEPYIEICLKQEAPLLQSYNTSQTSLACDVKGSERWTSGERPVDLYQVGSYGSCVSALRSRLVCAMEGDFVSKGAVKIGAVKSFQGGNHVNKKVPIQFAQSPLPIESFLHIQTWHTKYPSSGQHYALEFNVNFAGLAGMAFNASTLAQHRWNANAGWTQSIGNTDLLQLYDTRTVGESTLRATGLDHTRLPAACDPDYRHTAPEDAEALARAHAERVRAIMSGDAPPSFASSQPPVQSQQPSQSSGVPPQQATASGPTRSDTAANDQQVMLEPGRVLQDQPNSASFGVSARNSSQETGSQRCIHRHGAQSTRIHDGRLVCVVPQSRDRRSFLPRMLSRMMSQTSIQHWSRLWHITWIQPSRPSTSVTGRGTGKKLKNAEGWHSQDGRRRRKPSRLCLRVTSNV